MRCFVLSMLIAGVLFISCSASEQKNGKLTIAYSGNIGGQINPCGCRIPMGGYGRKASILNDLRSMPGRNMLVLDSGAILFNEFFLAPPTDKIQRHYAFVASNVIDMMGFDAINAAHFDLANSVDSLLAIDNANSAAWISSNLLWKESGEPIFQTGTVSTKGGLNIGLFGLMADDFLGAPLFDNDSRLEVADIIETAKTEVNALKDKTDMIVALCHMSRKKLNALCEEVPGIDIVIHSHNGYHDEESDTNNFQPEKIGETLVLRCPDGGRVLGVIELEMVNGSANFKPRESQIKLGSNIDRSIEYADENDSNYLNTFHILTAQYKTDPVIQAEIDKHEQSLQELKLRLGVQ